MEKPDFMTRRVNVLFEKEFKADAKTERSSYRQARAEQKLKDAYFRANPVGAKALKANRKAGPCIVTTYIATPAVQ